VLTLDVVRHATTAWNERGLMQGRRDIPLSDAGRAEAAGWRHDVEGARWVSSPLLRARETAERLAHGPVRIEPALAEMDWGEWEGHTLEDLRGRYGEAFAVNERRGLDFRPPGGESPRDVIGRVGRWLASLEDDGCPIVAVTHNGVIRAMLALATGWDMVAKPPVRFAPACAHRFNVVQGGRLLVVRCNIPLEPRSGVPL
jgi:probable phosphoglycerate mutase